MQIEKTYPNGMPTAAYVFEQYKDLDPSEKNKFKEMYSDYQDEQYRQASYTVNNAYKL